MQKNSNKRAGRSKRIEKRLAKHYQLKRSLYLIKGLSIYDDTL